MRTPVPVYLDTDTDRAVPLMARALMPETWNGYAVPTCTADAFRDFVHGSNLGSAWVDHVTGTLHYRDNDAAEWHPNGDADETWKPLAFDESGTAVYALTGWTWVA